MMMMNMMIISGLNGDVNFSGNVLMIRRMEMAKVDDEDDETIYLLY